MTVTQDNKSRVRPSVFLSYSHDDHLLVRRLVDALEAAGCDVFIDEEDIPAASEWREELKDGIKGSDYVVFVLSQTFVNSKECLIELEHAIECGKRLIPVAIEACEGVPPALAARQYIWMRGTDDFEPAFEELLAAVKTDLNFTRQHSRLMVRHDDWLTHNRSGGYLLRGAELTAAESWIGHSDEVTEPKPTTPLIQYVVVSRRASSRRRNLGVLALAVGLLLVAASLWLYQRQRAETVARHVSDAYQWMRREPLKAIDSAVAALAVDQSQEAATALSTAQDIAIARIENLRDEATIAGRPGFIGIGVMRWRTGEVYSRLRSDGRYALIASERGKDGASGGTGEVYLIDLNSMRTLELQNERTARRRLEYMGFSSDGSRVFITRQFELDVYELDGSLVFSKQLGLTAQPLHIASGYFHETWVLVCDSERQMWFVDTANGKFSDWTDYTSEGPAVLAEPSSSGRLAVIVFESGVVSLLTVPDPNAATMTKLDAKNVTFATFHDATGRFSTADKTGRVDVWALGTESPERIASFDQGVASGLTRFSDDGERLIAVAEDGSVRAWRIDSSELLASQSAR